jgi:RimJ/RimL family protein N-acetyltransferase
MPSFPPVPQPLAAAGVELRLAAERDIPETLIAHQDDPELYRRLRMRRPPSGAELGRRVEIAETERTVGARLSLTILSPGSDECRGQVDVLDSESHRGCVEMWVWVVPAARRHGLAAAAIALAGRWLIEAAAIERVQLLISPDNAPMLATAAGAGFAHEGRLRSHWRDGSGRADADVWSLVRRDLKPTTTAS